MVIREKEIVGSPLGTPMCCSTDFDGFELAFSKYAMSWEGIVHVRVRHTLRFELISIVCNRCFIEFSDL